MKGLLGGFFGAAHLVLDGLGKVAAFLLFGKRSLKSGISYAVPGGAVLGVICCTVFAGWATWEKTADVMTGAVVGGLLAGLVFGSILGKLVKEADRGIEKFIEYLNRK